MHSDDEDGSRSRGGGYGDQSAEEDDDGADDEGRQQRGEYCGRRLPPRAAPGNDDDDDNAFLDDGNNGEGNEEEEYRRSMYHNPICINNISRSLRVVQMKDAQIVEGRDGYCYFFTSMAEGPMLSSMALQQILVLLHVIHSYIPEECVLETDILKPTFDKTGGLDKIMEKVELSESEWERQQAKKREFSDVELSKISRYPFFFILLTSRCPGDRIGVQFVLRKVPPLEGWTSSH